MEQYTLSVIVIFIIVGMSKGWILGKGMMKNFPRRKKSAIIAASCLLVFFIISASISLDKITNTKNESEENPLNVQSIESILEQDWIMMSIPLLFPLITFLLGRGKIGKKSIKFLRGSMILYYAVYAIFMLTDWIPKDTAQSLLIMYQLGIVCGVFFGTGLSKNI